MHECGGGRRAGRGGAHQVVEQRDNVLLACALACVLGSLKRPHRIVRVHGPLACKGPRGAQ